MSLDVIYTFDAGFCRLDNALVFTEILQHFSAEKGRVGGGDNRLECSVQIPPFVVALDAVLDETSPRMGMGVYDVLDKFFPLKNCNPVDVLASVKKSQHFTGSSGNGGQVGFNFSVSSGNLSVGFVVLETGDSADVYACIGQVYDLQVFLKSRLPTRKFAASLDSLERPQH